MLPLCELECPQETLNLKTLRSVRVQLNNKFIENIKRIKKLDYSRELLLFLYIVYIMNYFFNLQLKIYSLLK